MYNSSNTHIREQEYFGWIGNCIFILAQLSQIIHTFKVKKTTDISYFLQFFWLIGNGMYTTFGFIDRSLSIFLGNGITLLMTMVQIGQKVYYDKKSKTYSQYEVIL